MKQWLWSFILLVIALGATAYLMQPADSADDEGPRGRVTHVNVVQPERAQIQDRLRAVGTARARNSVDIVSEVDGRIVDIHFTEGQQVVQGDRLVSLDKRQAQADMAVAEARLKDAEAKFRRAESLQKSNSISAAEVDELVAGLAVARASLELARSRLDNLEVVAPFDGVLGLKEVSVGAWLSAGQLITTLDSIDQMLVRFQVPQRYIDQLQSGQAIDVATSGAASTRLSGEVTELGSRVDPLSRTLTVQSQVSNPDARLYPGQFLDVSLTLDTRTGLQIPEQAVMTRGRENFVYVIADGLAKRVPLELGSRLAGRVEVVEGLTLEDRVVINGQDGLSSGDPVKVLDDDDALLEPAPSSQIRAGGDDQL
ncbi:efflux RND transporter periplasmic adaptor subunit [Hydrocarboniclastica marina]|uniref:Efflux RND transporter periplasmic adaptor subunit n=1 Tax=Hydrocarboniclastica marina TaxID=2259620 RepID=A0A4P7XKQ0_9ALTE|nr:efflux RND transporter periplasmic adaptor subunit [Hydrocarboniclastica marina]MAM00452.1 efflux transporter periplasmic adaptor subunit [Alteromonadaceae bacterium]QCF27711.1 efflux RND transporter periplasmic adaptor subunit [Hydrocarboniclastica marina]|tara:strand:+ start:1441 stop:2547 length:1107 start_codon:yes stop_codon:yes gene_type:complete